MIKLCDIGHTAKELAVHYKWTANIVEEFFCQGDDERARGMPISPFMERATENTFKNQSGFLNYVVRYTALCLVSSFCFCFCFSTFVLCSLFTATFHTNPAHNLTRPPYHILPQALPFFKICSDCIPELLFLHRLCQENYRYWCKMGEIQIILVSDVDPAKHYDLAEETKRLQKEIVPSLTDWGHFRSV